MEDDNNTASKLIGLKEILDFKENTDYKKLSCDEIKVLRDYITNLQQENEKIRKMNMHEHKYGSDMEEKYLIEKQKNERLIKELDNISLDEANIRADVLLEQQDYKSRIKKAVEFINDDENLWVALGEDCGRPDDDLEELLNILNGKE